MNVQRKPKLYFDTAPHAPGVTFDDGQCQRHLPWTHFRSAEWSHSDPATIQIVIGDWQVSVNGHNLSALFEALELAALMRIRPHPEFANDPAREIDVFATSIQFVALPSSASVQRKSHQTHLPL